MSSSELPGQGDTPLNQIYNGDHTMFIKHTKTRGVTVLLVYKKYILDLLQETNKVKCKPINTPLEANLKLRSNQRSTIGYCSFIRGNLVTWRAKKQKVVSRSRAEAEFRVMAQGICEALWIRSLLKELKVDLSRAIRLYYDNKSAIDIAHNLLQHDRTKYIEVD
ncbi:unnamed protein product [Spirodela intermedia]|uniref:Uncharacterized protein n=1 Tax=Spirodela intermedia TaxID=51605 RepID=A0A7I8ICI0_SPIIN|nr:unnamed protein product [Spirodela intermedia]CAA6654752.1 unnamed protein product [Spirodela intermedia]